MRKLIFLFISGLVALLLHSCAYDSLELSPCHEQESDTVSFNDDIIPIFNTHCNLSGCHSGANPEGGLNLVASNAYLELLQPGTGYVDTVTPKFSVLYIEMNSSTDPMPPTGKLDDCQIRLVYKWIEQKAKNN